MKIPLIADDAMNKEFMFFGWLINTPIVYIFFQIDLFFHILMVACLTITSIINNILDNLFGVIQLL